MAVSIANVLNGTELQTLKMINFRLCIFKSSQINKSSQPSIFTDMKISLFYLIKKISHTKTLFHSIFLCVKKKL